MTRLAIAVGFLSVFGVVAYAIVVLLTKKFKDEDRKNNESRKSDR